MDVDGIEDSPAVQQLSPSSRCQPSRHVTVEEVDDQEAGGLPKRPWIGEFPEPVATVIGHGTTNFEEYRAAQRTRREEIWAPFADEEEWELGKWLMKSGISQAAIDEYLKMPITRSRTKPSFCNNRAFFQRIDALPRGAEWLYEPIEVTGDMVDGEGYMLREIGELWRRDPVEILAELLGNPMFRESMCYAPRQLFRHADHTGRIWDETWTGDWWWEAQGLLPPGATVAPVIIASDKTQLSRFSGDKQAWPVYLSTANISKAVRRQPGQHATILLGYIPVMKLECFSNPKRRSLEGYRVFHSCMRAMLAPLVDAGTHGVPIICADGQIRRVHPLLAAYVADHPEQCLVSGCQENFCPKCKTHRDSLGDALCSVLKDPGAVLDIIDAYTRGEKPAEFKELGLRHIEPFWKDLPHCNIFECITPDLLHQLHKGVFKDHTVAWATALMDGGAAEVDRRFQALPTHPSLRHFKKGISLVTQWTGTEYKMMEKVFLGVLTGASEPDTLRAVRAVLDFIHYSHFEAHDDESLRLLEQSWATFHVHKHVFLPARSQKHFNIPKIHSAHHYGPSIRSRGSADGFNTEASERLHIDYAKRAYNASNKKEYVAQMTTWLSRQEAVQRFESYLTWARIQLRPTGTDSPSLRPTAVAISTLSPSDNRSPESSDDDTDGLLTNTPSGTPFPSRLPYTLAKTPGCPGVTIAHLIAHHGCTDFLHTLDRYLRKQSSDGRKLPTAAASLDGQTRIDVYKRVAVYLPPMRQVSRVPVKDTIRAVPAQPARILQKASPPHFDTVLIKQCPDDVPSTELTIQDLRVARVRAIFKLPADFGQRYNEPLAFVEWFTPFREPAPHIGLYKVSHSFHNHRRRVSIIPVSHIARSCHLLPVWGREVDRSWNSENIRVSVGL